MKYFKAKLKKRTFIEDMSEFLNAYRDDLKDNEIDLLVSVCNLVYVKFRELHDEEKDIIICSILDEFLSLNVKDTIQFLKENHLIKDASFLNVSYYYIRKYVLKKNLLI